MSITRFQICIAGIVCWVFTCQKLQSQTLYTGPVVTIGGLEWMAENLSVDHYCDGAAIPEAKTVAEWKKYNEKKTGCYTRYDNQQPYEQMYGKLYNWYAIKRGIAPHCWKIPERKDFDNLVAHMGNVATGKKLKAQHSWNNDWSGTNASSFNALAAGCRNGNGTFSYVGWKAFWWAIESRKIGNGRDGGLYFFINYDDKCDYDNTEDFGFSVRCVRLPGDYSSMNCPCTK